MQPAYIFSALNLINACDLTYPQVRNKRLHVEVGLTRICFLRRLTEANPFGGEKKTEEASVKEKKEPKASASAAEAPTGNKKENPIVITSYSIHYTKLYEISGRAP